MIEFNRYAVGKVIRQLRKGQNYSQEVLSGLAGIARSHLAMIESGSKQANFETLWRLANALNMQPHELVMRIEDEIAHSQG